MGIVRKQSILNLIISYTGVIIGFINVTLLFPEFFSEEEYGLRSVLLEASLILSFFFTFGAPNTINRFFPRIKNSLEQQKKILILLLLFPVCIFIFSSIVLYPFIPSIQKYYSTKSPLFSRFFYFIFPLGLLMAYFQLFCSLAIIHLKTVFQNFIRDIVLRLCTLILVILFANDIIDLTEFWVIFCIIYVILINFIVAANYNILKAIIKAKTTNYFQDIELKKVITFMSLSVLGSSATMVAIKIDILMISGQLGEKFAGIYGLSVYLLSLTDMPKRALASISGPIISHNIYTDFSEVKSILKKSSINLLLISGLIISIVLINLNSFYVFIPKGEFFKLGFFPFVILSASKILDGIIGFSGEIIAYSKHYWMNIITSIIALLIAILLNNILIPQYGLNGAAVATLIALGVSKTLRLLIVIWKFNITPFSQNYFLSLITSLSIILFAYKLNLHFSSIYVAILVNTLVVLTVFIGVILLFKPSQDIQQLIALCIKKVKKRL